MAIQPSDHQYVAWLVLHHSLLGDRLQGIKASDDFDLGRENLREWFDITEPSISAHHLRFHCVVFENGSDQDDDHVEPLVYMRVLSANPVRLESSCFNNTSILRKRDRDILLNHGDVLELNPSVSITFRTAHPPVPCESALSPLQQGDIMSFEARYAVSDRLLGSGGQACVFLATKQSDQSQLACKVVSLPQQRAEIAGDPQAVIEARRVAVQRQKKRDVLAREYSILKDLSHPNIVSLEKVLCTTYNIYIMQELLTGGDLLSYLDQTNALDEPEAAVIVRQVLKAVEYLHDQNIAHRDIKPENVLMTSWRPGARVVLTDFGQARTLANGIEMQKGSNMFRMQSMVGTYGYAAPELYKRYKHNDGYSKAIDIWSVGCIAGTLLTGEPMPFEEKGHDWSLEFMDSEKQRQWRKVGHKAKSFIRACLTFDESIRPSAKEALMHDWFTNKHYAANLEAAYQRAIKDWAPRMTNSGLIEFIDTSHIVIDDQQSSDCDSRSDQNYSHHFAANASRAPEAMSTIKEAVQTMKPVHNATSADPEMHMFSEDGIPLYASPIGVPESPPPFSQPNSFSDIVTSTYDVDAETQLSQLPDMASHPQFMLD
ncbi:hypothetical protein LTR78_006516 [Recurvomyces mirabilis]|uniref:Protein kinase domain-containing protein n=1 Tax=Recurvomyces mirabilis TaxID=574656 RepID=A0AAE1BZU6_9PEZI|nr:hypothetical protein LTR78_006516 [Recurvomyces mirabilis]KAK5151066.1 hypothetical protein LTS14_009561 [Recurvomyces mirabilis]